MTRVEFERVIQSVLELDRDKGTQQTETDSENAPRRLKFLLADDSVVNQEVAVGQLKFYGHEVTYADDGLKAVQKLSEQEFDVILVDLETPELDGIETTRTIRKKE